MERSHTTAASRRAAVRTELYDTVVRLASVSDSASLLRILSQDVRHALHCEVTYIATTDSNGETITAITASGEPAVRFSSVKTSKNTGVAGLVVSTGRVFSTSNYWEDDELRHDPEVDAILRQEALVAYAAAPIVSNGKTIGALLAAERHERKFTQFDLELLSEIASIAGPVLERVQRAEARETEIAQLTDSAQHAEAYLKTFMAPLEALTEEMSSPTVRDLTLRTLSQQFGVTATLKQTDESPNAVWTSVQEVPKAGRIGSYLHVECGYDPTNTWLTAASESTALLLGVVGLMEDSRAAADERTRGELLQDLLLGRSPDTLRERAMKLGVNEVLEEAAALVIVPTNPDRRGLRSMQTMSLLRKYSGLAEDQGTRVIVLLPKESVQERAEALAKSFFYETGTGYAGLSTTNSPHSYSRLVVEATSLAYAAKSIGATGSVATEARLGFVGAALGTGDNRVELIVSNELQQVIDYDRERGTELIDTMHNYVKNNFNARLTAENMVIHPKTVSQRLARISTLLGSDWAQYPRSLNIAAALELHMTRKALGKQT